MSTLTDPDADKKYAPHPDTQPGTADMSEFEQEFDNPEELEQGVAAPNATESDKSADAEQLKDKEERAPDRSGFSAGDDMRETLGKGYTGKGSRQSKGLAKLYNSDSKLKKRVAIAGAAAGGSLIGAILIFLALLPLKIDMLIQNIDQTFGAATNQALETETDNLFSDWVRESLLPALNTGACKRTIDPGCVPVDAGTGPIGKLYAGWKKNRLDMKLATDYGMTIGRQSNGRYVMNLHGNNIDLSELQTGQRSLFDLPGTKNVSSREIKAQINAALDGETKWKQVYKRYFITRKIDKVFGTYTHCLVLCDSREKVNLKLSDAKLGAKLWIANRVIAPRSTGAAALVTCMLDPPSCSTSISFDNPNVEDDNSPERSKAQQVADSLIANYLESHTLNDLAKLAESASDINRLGFSGYATKLIAQQIASQLGGDAAKTAAGETLDKTIPIVGWISLGVGITTIASTAPSIIKTLSYVTNSKAAAEMYTTYKTAADEMHSGNTDAEALGTLNDALSANSDLGTSHSDMTSTPVYNYVMGGSNGSGFTNAASIFGATTASTTDTSYKCNDGKPVQSGKLDCPEEDFSHTNSAALNSLANSGTLSTISHISGPIYSIISKPGELIGGVVSSIPGVSQVMSAISSFASGFISDALGTLLPNPFQDLSGGRTGDMIIAGGDVTQNGACYQNLGCAKVSSKTAAVIQNQQRQEAQDQFDAQPMFARMFSTDTPYSLVSRLAVAMPTSLSSGIENGMASIAANPMGSLFSSLSNMFTGNHAFAAVTPADDPFGVTQMAYASLPKHPADFWDKNCSTPAPGNEYGYYNDATSTWDASNWYNSSKYQEQDPNTGQAVATATNPCMLITAAIGAGGGLDDPSLLPSDTQTSSTTTATGPTSLRIATYNVDVAPAIAGDSERVTATNTMASNNFDVVGMQELENQGVFDSITNKLYKLGYNTYPAQGYKVKSGSNDMAATTIAWNSSKFTLVGTDELDFPRNVHNTHQKNLPQPDRNPIVILKNTATGQEIIVMNAHYTSDKSNTHANAEAERYAASQAIEAKIKSLQTQYAGIPIFLTGDFNEGYGPNGPGDGQGTNNYKRTSFCMLWGDDLMRAPSITSPQDYCKQGGKRGGIDHILISQSPSMQASAKELTPASGQSSSQSLGTDHASVPYVDVTITGTGSAATSNAGKKIVFASYNMCDDQDHYNSGSGTNSCPHIAGNGKSTVANTTKKASLISSVITGTSSVNSRPIDIAAVQELSQSNQKNLETDLGSSYQFFPSKVARNNAYAVVWNSSKFTMVDNGCLSEKVTGGSLMGNGNNEHLDGSANCSTDQSSRSNAAGFPWVQLQSSSGKSIYVMSIHLPNNCYGSRSIRSNDAQKIYQYWVKPKLSTGATVIVSGDWNWSGSVSCGNYWDGNNKNANPLSAYCEISKGGNLQAAIDIANDKVGQCPSSERLPIDQPFVSAGISASNYKHIDSNDAGTDHSPAIVALTSESGF